MGKYKKDISYVLKQEDVQDMINKAMYPRDRALVALLYLTGARPSELMDLKNEDITVKDDGYVYIKLKTTKLGRAKGFTVSERILEIPRDAPFMEHIIAWVDIKPDYLIEINTSRIRQIIYNLSNDRFCPYNFRHTRFIKLSRAGASMDELMYWKGAKDKDSVTEYLKAKPIGRKLVID